MGSETRGYRIRPYKAVKSTVSGIKCYKDMSKGGEDDRLAAQGTAAAGRERFP